MFQEKSKELQELIEILDMAPNDYGYVKYKVIKYIDELSALSKAISYADWSFICDKYFVNFSEEQLKDLKNSKTIKTMKQKHLVDFALKRLPFFQE